MGTWCFNMNIPHWIIMSHHNTSIVNSHVPGLLLCKISCNYPINGMTSSNMYWHEVCILILPITFIWNVPLAKQHSVRYDKFMQSAHHFCSVLTQLGYPWHIWIKFPSIKFHKNPCISQSCCSKWTDEWTVSHFL